MLNPALPSSETAAPSSEDAKGNSSAVLFHDLLGELGHVLVHVHELGETQGLCSEWETIHN